MNTDVTVVIVNYRVKWFLEQTLKSVLDALQGLQAEVLVVDNNSGDDSIALSRSEFPQVRFIQNNDNVGFARANNQAIAQARGTYTLILNPDTVVTARALRACVGHMERNPRCGGIGVRMVDGDGNFLPESKRAFPTPWVSFCKIFGLSKLFPRSRWFAKYHLRYLDDRQPHAVDILAGAFLFCRTALLQQLNGFDEDFFMYGEDIDLSYRITQAGYQNWYLPEEIIHYKGESTHKDSMRYVRVFYDAMLIFYRKHFPQFSRLFYYLVKLGVWVRAGMAMARRALKRLLRRRSHPAHDRRPWVILSDDPQAVSTQTGITVYSTEIPSAGDVRVLIDDGCRSSDQIVAFISDNHAPRRSFSIYARRHRKVITPKMSQE